MPRNRRSERAMATKEILRRGLCFLAGLLALAPAVLASSSANARAYHHHVPRAVHFVSPGKDASVLKRAAANGPRQPQGGGGPETDGSPSNAFSGAPGEKSGKQPNGWFKKTSPSAPAKTANAPELPGEGFRAGRHAHHSAAAFLYGEGPGTIRQAKSKIAPIGFRYSHIRHPFPSAKSRRNTRNAIGLSIVPRGAGPASNAALVRSPTNLAPSSSAVVIRPSAGRDHFAVSRPGFQVTEPGASRPALNGNGFARRGFVPSTLGGPSKNVVVGIDGSTMRSKH